MIGGGGLCLDKGSASLQNLVFSEGCNDSLTELWIRLDTGLLVNNHFDICLSSGNANGATLGGRGCSSNHLDEWFPKSTDNSGVSTRGRGGNRIRVQESFAGCRLNRSATRPGPA